MVKTNFFSSKLLLLNKATGGKERSILRTTYNADQHRAKQQLLDFITTIHQFK